MVATKTSIKKLLVSSQKKRKQLPLLLYQISQCYIFMRLFKFITIVFLFSIMQCISKGYDNCERYREYKCPQFKQPFNCGSVVYYMNVSRRLKSINYAVAQRFCKQLSSYKNASSSITFLVKNLVGRIYNKCLVFEQTGHFTTQKAEKHALLSDGRMISDIRSSFIYIYICYKEYGASDFFAGFKWFCKFQIYHLIWIWDIFVGWYEFFLGHSNKFTTLSNLLITSDSH